MSKILHSLFNLASQTEAKAFKNYILHLLTHFIHAAFSLNLYNGFMDWLLKIVSRWLYSSSCFPVLEHSVFADLICQFSNNGTWFSHWTLASTPIYWLRRRYNHFLCWSCSSIHFTRKLTPPFSLKFLFTNLSMAKYCLLCSSILRWISLLLPTYTTSVLARRWVVPIT